jgi:hypothetical protein
MRPSARFLIVLLVLALVLSACGGSTPSPTKVPEKTAAPVQQPTLQQQSPAPTQAQSSATSPPKPISTPVPSPTSEPTAISAPATSAPQLPQSDEWMASTDFGKLTLVMNPSRTGIAKVSFDFSDFTCGPITQSGSFAVSKLNSQSWPITDGEFTVEVPGGPPGTEATVMLTIKGIFDRTGTQASGTWRMDISETICSGTWMAE